VGELSEIIANMDKTSVIYYADGVHPTRNSRPTYAWIEKRQEMKQPTVSGRDRVNINALFNAKDITDVIAHECESVNAGYYRNRTLTQWLEGTKIRQIFLPAYSLNLNLTESLWRFLKKKVINTGFYRTKELFRKAVMKFFENIAGYRQELETLLTLNSRLVNSHSISF
jgi:hypothetical protein